MLPSIVFVGLIVLVAGVGCNSSSSSSSGCSHNPPFRSSPAWSPDGRKIAFARGDKGVGDWEIYVINADGRGERQLTRPPTRVGFQAVTDFSSGAWSPDGRKIVFATGAGISVMNADGSNQRQLTRISDAADPAWSPDGREIAFVRTVGSASTSYVYVTNANGTNQHRLTRSHASGGQQGGPVWSPHGQTIAFTSGEDRVVVMNANGTRLRRLTRNTTGYSTSDYTPTWSPDGQKLAYTSYSDVGTSWIDVANADGSGHRQLTMEAASDMFSTCWSDQDPAWSPDGRKIAFDKTGGSGDDPQLYVMNADGSDQHALIHK